MSIAGYVCDGCGKELEKADMMGDHHSPAMHLTKHGDMDHESYDLCQRCYATLVEMMKKIRRGLAS